MLVNAIDTSLEYAEKSFRCIGMDMASAVFPLAMSYNVLVGELRADQAILPGIIGHKMSIGYNLLLEDR